MSHAKEFRDFVRSIALSETEFLEQLNAPKNPLMVKPGPNDWDAIKNDVSKFGPEHDFELYDQGETTVFYPVSEAALQWSNRFLPTDLDRWGERGLKIETQWIDMIVRQAKHDRLMSEDEFDEAMAEMQEITRQWE
jgi:hypothetical protein